MTKRHFVAIANILSTMQDKDEQERLAKLFIQLCISENPQFRPMQFLSAVNGMTWGKGSDNGRQDSVSTPEMVNRI